MRPFAFVDTVPQYSVAISKTSGEWCVSQHAKDFLIWNDTIVDLPSWNSYSPVLTYPLLLVVRGRKEHDVSKRLKKSLTREKETMKFVTNHPKQWLFVVEVVTLVLGIITPCVLGDAAAAAAAAAATIAIDAMGQPFDEQQGNDTPKTIQDNGGDDDSKNNNNTRDDVEVTKESDAQEKNQGNHQYYHVVRPWLQKMTLRIV